MVTFWLDRMGYHSVLCHAAESWVSTAPLLTISHRASPAKGVSIKKGTCQHNKTNKNQGVHEFAFLPLHPSSSKQSPLNSHDQTLHCPFLGEFCRFWYIMHPKSWAFSSVPAPCRANRCLNRSQNLMKILQGNWLKILHQEWHTDTIAT